ncbi:hypothetical protein N6H14_21990 [Paenibacillus sp. CC-CFT747]|nr:hypothetical protein N6H14_21990 [Paenibacillus sp. CC-CFT747]
MLTVKSVNFDDHIPHWHNRMKQVQSNVLILVTEGKVQYRWPTGSRVARQGDLVYIPAGTVREARNTEEGTHQKYTVLFTYSPDLFLPLLQVNEPVDIPTRRFSYYKDRMESLYRHTQESKDFYSVIQAGILLELLGTACRDWTAPRLPLSKEARVDKIEKHLLAHYRKTVRLEELASLIGRSPNYTLTLFKQAVGQSPLPINTGYGWPRPWTCCAAPLIRDLYSGAFGLLRHLFLL